MLKQCKRCLTMKNIKGKKVICKRCEDESNKETYKSKLPFQLSNHEIGCILESYVDIIGNRGFEREAQELLELASKLK